MTLRLPYGSKVRTRKMIIEIHREHALTCSRTTNPKIVDVEVVGPDNLALTVFDRFAHFAQGLTVNYLGKAGHSYSFTVRVHPQLNATVPYEIL